MIVMEIFFKLKDILEQIMLFCVLCNKVTFPLCHMFSSVSCCRRVRQSYLIAGVFLLIPLSLMWNGYLDIQNGAIWWKCRFFSHIQGVYYFTCTCTHTHTYKHTYIHTNIHTHIHTYTYIHTVHTYIQTYIHTYIYIHTIKPNSPRYPCQWPPCMFLTLIKTLDC